MASPTSTGLGDPRRELVGQDRRREVGRLEHAVHERADARARGRVGQQRRDGLQRGVGGRRADRHRILLRRVVGADRLLDLAGHPRLVGPDGDRAVGQPPPARVERPVEDRHVQRRRRRLARRPARALVHERPLQHDRRPRLERPEPVARLVRGLLRPRPARSLKRLQDQPPERRLAAVERARPPHHGLVLGPRQRDVGQPQLLAPLLLAVLRGVLDERRIARVRRHVDGPRVAPRRVVVDRRRRLVGDPERVPQERAVDDAELQALAAVHGQHLHRGRVGLQPPRPVLGARVALVGRHPPPQPAGQRGDPQPPVDRRAVQQLGDVAQVGQLALATHHRQQPLGQRLGLRDRLHDGRHARAPQHARPPVQRLLQLTPALVGRAGDRLRRPAHERRQRHRAGPRQRLGTLQRLQQRQPVARRAGREDAARAVDHGRDADRLQRRLDRARLVVLAHEHRDVGGAERPVRNPRAGGQ